MTARGVPMQSPPDVPNCSDKYGPYQCPEKLIPLMVLKAIEGKPPPVYGRGQNGPDWLYMEDHVDALVAPFERGRPGGTFLIGARAGRGNLSVVRAICDLVDE
jgi:dTDP-glucose 4,6-dehydratase